MIISIPEQLTMGKIKPLIIYSRQNTFNLVLEHSHLMTQRELIKNLTKNFNHSHTK